MTQISEWALPKPKPPEMKQLVGRRRRERGATPAAPAARSPRGVYVRLSASRRSGRLPAARRLSPTWVRAAPLWLQFACGAVHIYKSGNGTVNALL